MPSSEHRRGLFPALLKHWRGKRGLSQLDLALAADVSSRHVSFLETGRSSPSMEMVVRLGAALDVPLRHVNAMLVAAGHERVYDESPFDAGMPAVIAESLRLMKKHHEPFPLVVINRAYDIVDLNEGARALFATAIPGLFRGGLEGINLLRATFSPDLAQPLIANFDEVGREILWRVKREVLAEPDDGDLAALVEEVLEYPTVSASWRESDFGVPSSPVVPLHLTLGDLELRFVTAVTAFQAPQSVLVDELRIESWYPADEATASLCQAFAASR